MYTRVSSFLVDSAHSYPDARQGGPASGARMGPNRNLYPATGYPAHIPANVRREEIDLYAREFIFLVLIK